MRDKNALGKAVALALIAGAAFGIRAIARGGFSCPFGAGSSCVMGIPAAAPAPAVEAKAAPEAKSAPKAEAAPKAEPVSDSGDDEAAIEAKAPVAPPAAAPKADAPK